MPQPLSHAHPALSPVPPAALGHKQLEQLFASRGRDNWEYEEVPNEGRWVSVSHAKYCLVHVMHPRSPRTLTPPTTPPLPSPLSA